MKDMFSCEYEKLNLSFASSFYSIYEAVYNTFEIFIGFPAFYSNLEEIKEKVTHDTLVSFIDANPLIKLKMFALCFVEFFIYWWNILVCVLWFMIYSPIEFLALFCPNVQSYDTINESTGNVVKRDGYITFPRAVSNLCEWVMDSRNDFENSPDTSFFGKSFSRIFNLIYNYIFKFLILGSLLIATYPSVIMFNIAMCLVVFFASPLLSLLAVLFEWIFNLMVYDCINNTNFISPLFRNIIWNLIIKGVFQFIGCVLFFMVQPLVAVFMFIFATFFFTLRIIYDF